jgi:hypothetical protein
VDWPSFVALVALVALLAVGRLLILSRWRSYRLSHRQAAALYAALVPLLLVAGFAFMGASGQGFVLIVGVALAAFASTYAIAVFFLRAFGGEMDPPASRGYRRRP